MTYAQGGLIAAADFNGLLATGSPNINTLWSTGSGSQGYGQTIIAPVSASSLVDYTDWAALFSAINDAADHQGTTITALPVPASNDLIAYESTLSAALAAIQAGYLNCGSVGTDITNSGTRTAAWGTASAIPTVTSTVTVTFASAAQARYFFNCGGQILVSCSRSGGTSNSVNSTWTTLCTNIGTIGLPAVSTAQTLASASYLGLTRFGGGGATPDIYVRNGFYDLTSTPTSLFRQFASAGVYTSDHVEFSYSATATVVTISIVFTDDATDAVNVDGNLTVTAIARPPESTYITNTWGTPVVAVTAPA
jgi:hypothetical protein